MLRNYSATPSYYAGFVLGYDTFHVLAAFGKNGKANISTVEKKDLSKLIKELVKY